MLLIYWRFAALRFIAFIWQIVVIFLQLGSHIDRNTIWSLHRPAKSHGTSVSLQKWCMISRSHGNVTKSHGIEGIWLIFYFSAKKPCFSCESERYLVWIREMVITGTWNLHLHKQPIVSPEDGATWITSTAQWRHKVIMMITSLDDQDSRNSTCSTWQLWLTVYILFL